MTHTIVGIGINAKTKPPSEAWLFANFLRSEYVQRKIVEKSFGIPYRRSVFHDDFKKKSPELYRIVASILDNAEEPCVSENTRNKIYHMGYPMLERIFSGEFTLEGCIHSLRKMMNEILILDDIQRDSFAGRTENVE